MTTGVWVVDWFVGSLQPDRRFFSRDLYPAVYGWRDRYQEAVLAAKDRVKSVQIQGPEAVSFITRSDLVDKDIRVEEDDPLRLTEGTEVELFPTDSGGFTHQVCQVSA